MLRKITFFVIACHFGLALVLLLSPASTIPRTTKHLAVRTKSLPAPIKASSAKKIVAAPPQQPKAKKTAPQPAAKPKAAPPVPKPGKKSIASNPARPPPPKQKEPSPDVWIEPAAPVKKLSKVVELPVPVLPLVIDSTLEQPQETLIHYLHDTLRLPEYGEVKIELILLADGTVGKLTVLKSESVKNKAYLEKNIPLLKFPLTNVLDSSKKEQRYILTFCNEI